MIRSYLFVPGDKPEVLKKADQRGADALIVDLEDAVAQSRKDEARRIASHWLRESPVTNTEKWVRINPGRVGSQDVKEVIDATIDGLILPKIRTVEDVNRLADIVQPARSTCRLIVLIETAAAMRDIDRIASHPWVLRLMIGEADLSASTGIALGNPVWDALRAEVVVASAAAGIEPPIGPVNPDFSSPKDLEDETRQLKEMGFTSRALIHPAQVGPVHRGFQPTPEQVEDARRRLAIHEEALRGGQGVHVGEDGRMADEAFVLHAKQILELAEVIDPERDRS